jgi:hypothetical protein
MMASRFRRPPTHEDLENEQRELFTAGVGRLLALAFGVALLLGLASGALWIAWNLLRLHVFR